MKPFTQNRLTKIGVLVKHEQASKAFDVDLFYSEEPMWFEIADSKDRIYIYVPRGFLTDGASIPKYLQKLFPVWDNYYQAAVFHDYLCEYLVKYVNDVPVKISRSEADQLFNDVMKFQGINAVKRKLVIAGVVTYGHVKSIIYPSATLTKRKYEDEIRAMLDMRDKAREDQKKKTA